MKALFIVTGRGIGGDAVTALNIAHALSKYGVECEFALDHSAPGLLLKKHDLNWYKISIPQAGGHAATKKTLAKAAVKTSKAAVEAARLIRKVKPDVVVGVIGGGAVVGCLGAKMANTPSVGILITPADAKVCTKITTTVALPESNLFQLDMNDERIHKAFSPVDPEIVVGNKDKALDKLPEEFDSDRPTILFSSGSTLFEKMALGASKLGKSGVNANILVVGDPLEEKYREYLKEKNIIYLGYIDWIRDLYKIIDLAVLTDDGMMIQEAIACQLPIIALLGVKYGRYHNLAAIFEGAVLESELEDILKVTEHALTDLGKLKENALKYSEDVLKASDKIANIIYNRIEG
ncbi:MAG: undecaprenyldiphospho-muramoylpentapeptide beta-N- acetylglucosaminyltransferase [Methanobacterium sp. PtaB.Bin024]|jgi:UDP-N-acetylglucosamine--N-acetylmuramyl-(pentapeptide) pyrophosphoryl-undecaprenol N-acetylglucosamine transferase|nr:MAG: undecaprenyldiphospho-muramoylpentapeptide beta-N- acetylglucosaminyltransferase [Methanobacterium sp. PtaB.Bin024]